MQNRYAADIGDYIKFALLRAIAHDETLGVAWYLCPDESHNSDGRHIDYLSDPHRWRHLDPELFDALARIVRTTRSTAAVEQSGILGPEAIFAAEPILTTHAKAQLRSYLRTDWFSRTLTKLKECTVVFADPDNGLIDNGAERRRQRSFGKQMPLNEAIVLANGRTAVVYHHNTRFRGGHDAEIDHWCNLLPGEPMAVRANAYSCRTFFVFNATARIRSRVEAFCSRWSEHKVSLRRPGLRV